MQSIKEEIRQEGRWEGMREGRQEGRRGSYPKYAERKTGFNFHRQSDRPVCKRNQKT